MKTLFASTITRCSFRLALVTIAASTLTASAQWLPTGPLVVPPVRITSPVNHATFYAPVNIPIFAFTTREYSLSPIVPTLGSVTNVEFFAGTNDLGAGFNLGASGSPFALRPIPAIYGNITWGSSLTRLGNVYCLTWTNAAPGAVALTAVAKGPAGYCVTSAPVNITISTSPTNTNPTALVSIYATDPIAIAGTNAYVWRGVTNVTPAWTNWNPSVFRWFTNWGPKNALFTVQRLGNANSDLTVRYRIGGTASNGVDYATLPGSVTVPAGAAYTLIPIVPIDNGVTNRNKTVVLTLLAATNMPADYLLRPPTQAAALIIENGIRPASALLSGGGFHLNATGPDGAWFYVEYSTDFVNWTTASTNQVFQGSIDFIDPDTTSHPNCFYRAVPLPASP